MTAVAPRVPGHLKPTIEKFHRAFYDLDVQSDTYWMGVTVCKCPMDLMAYQEIVWETRPELIVETGSFQGGSALFLAHMLELAGVDGKVLSIDLSADRDLPDHPRIDFVAGASSIDPAVLALVEKEAHGKRTMVILDSDHQCDHVLQELRAYSRFVSQGCYLVVEDTNVNGHPALAIHGPGPWEAVKAWQPTNHGYEVDKRMERWLMTFNPGGFLRRIR